MAAKIITSPAESVVHRLKFGLIISSLTMVILLSTAAVEASTTLPTIDTTTTSTSTTTDSDSDTPDLIAPASTAASKAAAGTDHSMSQTPIRISEPKIQLNGPKDFDHYLKYFKDDPRKPALLLDFDGTLAEITQHPKDTFMSPDTRKWLTELTKREDVFTAIISGRGLVDLKDKIPVEGITKAGNHGLEIKYPNGTIYNYPIPQELQNSYKIIYDLLQDTVATDGAWVEDKRVSITFHYREAPLELHDEMRRKAMDIIRSHGYRANQAHFAIEAKPPVEWNKGYAAKFILETTFGPEWRDQVKVIVAGDDATDEDAMRMLKGVATSFRVTRDVSVNTAADFTLQSPAEVCSLLQWVSQQSL